MARLVRYLIRGSLVLAPLGATLYVMWLALSTIDRILPVGIPGLGLLLTLGLVALVGFLTSNVVGASVVELGERQLARLPLFKLIYGSIKDLIDAFVGDKRRFSRPVLVALDASGAIKTLGFVTRDPLEFADQPDFVGVYFPQSYNFAGNVLLVRRDRIEPLPVESGQVMTFIVSGGVSGFSRGEPGQRRTIPPLDVPPPRAPNLGLDDGATALDDSNTRLD